MSKPKTKADLEKELKAVNKQVDSLSEQVDEAIKERDQARNLLNEKNRLIEDSNAALAKAQEGFKSTEKLLKDVTADRDKWKKDFEYTQNQLNSAMEMVETLSEEDQNDSPKPEEEEEPLPEGWVKLTDEDPLVPLLQKIKVEDDENKRAELVTDIRATVKANIIRYAKGKSVTHSCEYGCVTVELKKEGVRFQDNEYGISVSI